MNKDLIELIENIKFCLKESYYDSEDGYRNWGNMNYSLNNIDNLIKEFKNENPLL